MDDSVFPDPTPTTPDPYRPPQVEAIFRQIRELVASARPMPLSSSSMVNQEELLAMVDEAISRLPEEVRAARWLLKEREEFLTKVRREGDEILELARARAERLVQRTEVVRNAEMRARQMVEAAREETIRMKRQTEEYCDQKLGSFERILATTKDNVTAGRLRLQETELDREKEKLIAEEIESKNPSDSHSETFLFDQDDADR